MSAAARVLAGARGTSAVSHACVVRNRLGLRGRLPTLTPGTKGATWPSLTPLVALGSASSVVVSSHIGGVEVVVVNILLNGVGVSGCR